MEFVESLFKSFSNVDGYEIFEPSYIVAKCVGYGDYGQYGIVRKK